MSRSFNDDMFYRMDIILKKTKINKDAFYNILQTLNIANERYIINLLNFTINANLKSLNSIADELIKLHTSQ